MNERFTQTIRKTHDTRNERTIHETNARYTKRTIWKTQMNERMIHETNERYTKQTHDTNTRYTNERIIGA